MTPDEAREVAGLLTKAQAKALVLIPSEPTKILPIAISRVTRDRLIGLGLVQKKTPSAFGMVRWWLSEDGVAVARILQENRSDD